MPRRSKDIQGKFLRKTATSSSSQPSSFFDCCELPSLNIGELEDPLSEQPEIPEERIGEEEPTSPTQTMDENKNNEIFPIRETNGEARMENISLSSLPHFHGITFEDSDTFMFEFFFVYRTYDYASNDQKLKLFPSSNPQRCNIALVYESTWRKHHYPGPNAQTFNNKSWDYCSSKETKEEILRMTLGLDESLKDYKEKFQLNHRMANCTFDIESLKQVLLRGIREDVMENLNMLSGGDIYQFPYDDIKTLFKN